MRRISRAEQDCDSILQAAGGGGQKGGEGEGGGADGGGGGQGNAAGHICSPSSSYEIF